jgi:type VII secretion-associated serine protease mycosin
MRRLTALVLAIAISAAPATSAFAESIRDRQYWLEQYGFVSAWEISKGEGVKVAVIDTGIDASHPALVGQVVGGFDVSGIGTYDGLTPIGQNSYHGTMVASLIAGREGTEGIVGVAPESELLSVSMAFGVDGLDTDSQIAKAIIWSVDNGAKVINLSLTRNSTSWPKSWDEAFLYAFEKDVVVVAAVGNSADGTEQISAPATIPGVVSVAGLDKNGIASTTQSLSGFTIAVTAPAEQLVGAYPGGEYRLWSGTSGAAPIVSGLVALIRSAYPELDSAGVIKRLLDSSSKFGFEGYSTSYGYGAINAEAALSGEYDTAKENPLGSLAKWIELYRTGADSEQAGQIVTPFDDDVGPLEPGEQTLSNGPAWLPIALYAGVGLFGLFLYFTFRPQRRGPVTR